MAEGGTATALIDAAEEQFADRGFESASLRAVMRAARSDPGAVHYHFGGREALAAAVLDRVLAPLNARRLELLEAAETAGGSAPVPGEALVDAIVRPDLEAATELQSRGRGRARLIGAIYLNPARFVTDRVEQHFAPVAARFMPHLAVALPGVPADVVAWRVRWCLFGVVGALLADDDEPFSIGFDQLIDRIVTTGAAAMAAPIERKEGT